MSPILHPRDFLRSFDVVVVVVVEVDVSEVSLSDHCSRSVGIVHKNRLTITLLTRRTRGSRQRSAGENIVNYRKLFLSIVYVSHARYSHFHFLSRIVH